MMIRRTVAALSATLVAAVVPIAAPAADAAVSKSHGCPLGAVCVYPHGSWNGDHPSLFFYSYGGHNLSNQTGTHRVYNHQTSNADAWLCKGYDGKGGFTLGFNPPQYQDVSLTPINSIQLTPRGTDIRQVGCQGGTTEKIPR